MKYFLPFLILLASAASAQNLVPNCSFEQYSVCPLSNSELYKATGWWAYTGGTPDYMNSCTTWNMGVPSNSIGYENAAHGNGYAGIFTYHVGSWAPNYKEYIATKITPMQPGFLYQVSMSVSVADSYLFAGDDMGVWLYDSGPDSTTNMFIGTLPKTPQVSYSSYGVLNQKNGWTRITKTFEADSTYDHIVIGGFKTYNNMTIASVPPAKWTDGAYYYIDSVVIIQADSVNLVYADTMSCAGDSLAVSYTLMPGIFASNNVVTLQLSDASGSFATPLNIGSKTTNTSGSFKGLLPLGIPSGNGYRVRLVTSNPATVSNVSYNTIGLGMLPPAKPVAGSNSPLCVGQTLNLTATTTSPITGWAWTGPGGYFTKAQNPVRPGATLAMAGTYVVTAFYYGCFSKDTETVVVNIVPATPSAGSSSPVCAGGVLSLSATSTTPGVNYNWTGPNGYVSNVQNPVLSPAALNMAGTYNVTAQLNGCTSTGGSTTVAITNISSLGVYPSPNDTVCINNANASFVAVPFNAGTSQQYQWYKNNSLIGGATNITYPASGIADGDSFYCRMTVTGLCAEPLVLYSNKVGMTVLPTTAGPTVTITANPGTLLSPWQLVEFTAVASNAGAMPKYQWKRNGQDVIGATGNNWSANNLSNGDTISCVVTSSVWCASPASEVSNRMVVNIKTGITDIGADRKLELYPNPNNGSFVVYLPLPPSGGGHWRVDVVDALGRTVYSNSRLQITNSKLEVVLPTSVANGVYMLKLNADGVVYHARFTVGR